MTAEIMESGWPHEPIEVAWGTTVGCGTAIARSIGIWIGGLYSVYLGAALVARARLRPRIPAACALCARAHELVGDRELLDLPTSGH